MHLHAMFGILSHFFAHLLIIVVYLKCDGCYDAGLIARCLCKNGSNQNGSICQTRDLIKVY